MQFYLSFDGIGKVNHHHLNMKHEHVEAVEIIHIQTCTHAHIHILYTHIHGPCQEGTQPSQTSAWLQRQFAHVHSSRHSKSKCYNTTTTTAQAVTTTTINSNHHPSPQHHYLNNLNIATAAYNKKITVGSSMVLPGRTMTRDSARLVTCSGRAPTISTRYASE